MLLTDLPSSSRFQSRAGHLIIPATPLTFLHAHSVRIFTILTNRTLTLPTLASVPKGITQFKLLELHFFAALIASDS